MNTITRGARRLVLAALLGVAARPGAAQDRRDEQFYYPGAFNWQFLRVYPEAARLFNAFDYGHAVLYERLYTRPDSPGQVAALARDYDFLTRDLLVRPPRFAVAEEVIEPTYARLAWRAKMMFDWAHVLHRQIYDVYADDRVPETEKDYLIERLTDYYLSNRRYAFTQVPKAMELMDGQYYSQVFRRHHPAFNGLIWAYHWLQVGLYEPLIAGRTPSEKKAGVNVAVARFWDMLRDPPGSMPSVMPMTATVAPAFTGRHPRAAAIFDNLHMMHDIISDILAADTVPHAQKGAVIAAALDEFQDGTRHVMSREEWLMMGDMMGGIGAMGGPVTGILRARAGAEPPAQHRHSEPSQAPDEQAVRLVLEAVAAATAAKNLAALDTLHAQDAWVRIIEGADVNQGWTDYRDHHLGPELAEFLSITYRIFDAEPQVRGNIAWAPFRYELSVQTSQGQTDVEGRGTAILEKRGGRWLIVHWHTSGRRRAAR